MNRLKLGKGSSPVPVAKGVSLCEEFSGLASETRDLFRNALETAWANRGRWVEIKFSAEHEVSQVRPAFVTLLGADNARRRESSLFIRAEYAGE